MNEAFRVVWAYEKPLTPLGRLLAIKLASRSNRHGVSMTLVDDLIEWTGASSVQLRSAFMELLMEKIITGDVHPLGDLPEIVLATFIAHEGAGYEEDWPEEFRESAAEGEGDPHAHEPTRPVYIDGRRTRIFAKTGGKCFYCREADAAHLDHMLPSSRGGSNEDHNMIGACGPCNIRKNDRTVEEYRAYLSHKTKTDTTEVVFFGERAA